MKVLLRQRSSVISGARWCRPIGWEPKNKVVDSEFVDGSWRSQGDDEAGLICFLEGTEGTEIEVELDDLKVAFFDGEGVLSEVQV